MTVSIIAGNKLANMTGGLFYTSTDPRLQVGTSILGKSPASILKEYLIGTSGLMSVPTNNSTWPLYVSSIPDGSNVKTNAGAVYDTPGINDPRQMNGSWPIHHGIQLKIRSQSHEVGYVKIEALASALDEIDHDSVIINGVTYNIQNVSRTSSIIPLGLEEGTKRRYLFTLNFITTIKKL